MYLARKALSYFYPESETPATQQTPVLEDASFEDGVNLQKPPGFGTWVAVNDDQTRFIFISGIDYLLLDLTNPHFLSRGTLSAHNVIVVDCVIKTANNEITCFDQVAQRLIRFQIRHDVKNNCLALAESKTQPCYMPTVSSYNFVVMQTYVALAGNRYSKTKMYLYDANTLIFIGRDPYDQNKLELHYIDISTMKIKRSHPFRLTSPQIFKDFTFEAPDKLHLLVGNSLLSFKLQGDNFRLDSNYSVPFDAEKFWVSPIPGTFIFAYQDAAEDGYRLANCKVVNNRIITLFEKNGPQDFTNQCYVLPCGQFVYYDNKTKAGKSVCLITGREASYPSQENEDLFVTQAEGRYRIGVVSLGSTKRFTLSALAHYDMKHDESYPAMKETLSGLPLPEKIKDVISDYMHDVRLFSKINPALRFNESIEADIFREFRQRILKAGHELQKLTPENSDFARFTLIKQMLNAYYAIIIKNPELSFLECRQKLKDHPLFKETICMEQAPGDMRSTLEFMQRVTSTTRPIKQESKNMTASP